MILKSEIRGDLPVVVLSLSDSNEFQTISEVEIPSQIQKVKWKVTLAHNVFVAVEEVPEGYT